MHTLIALGTGVAWIYSTIALLFPAHLPVARVRRRLLRRDGGGDRAGGSGPRHGAPGQGADLGGDQEADRASGQDRARPARRQGAGHPRGGGAGGRHRGRPARGEDPRRRRDRRGRLGGGRVHGHRGVPAGREARWATRSSAPPSTRPGPSASARRRWARTPRWPASSGWSRTRRAPRCRSSASWTWCPGTSRRAWRSWPSWASWSGTRSGPSRALVYALIVAVTTLIIACPCALGHGHADVADDRRRAGRAQRHPDPWAATRSRRRRGSRPSSSTRRARSPTASPS